jgi:hypothetical protein
MTTAGIAPARGDVNSPHSRKVMLRFAVNAASSHFPKVAICHKCNFG